MQGQGDDKEQALHHAAEEIRFFRGQQWHVANYALLSYATLIAASRLIESSAIGLLAGLHILVVMVAGLGLLWSLEEAFAKERGRLFSVREDHLPLIERHHRGERREYKSASSQWLARFTIPASTPTPRIGSEAGTASPSLRSGSTPG